MRFWVSESRVEVKRFPYTPRDEPPNTATLTIAMEDSGETEAAYFKAARQIIDLINEAGYSE